MVEHWSILVNYGLVCAFSLLALWGVTFFVPLWGGIPMVLVFIALMMTSFFTSHYLNSITASHQRATVLSFKGLAFNAAYGCIGIMYAGLISGIRRTVGSADPGLSRALVENEAFRRSISWFPLYLIAVLFGLFLICRLLRRFARADTL